MLLMLVMMINVWRHTILISNSISNDSSYSEKIFMELALVLENPDQGPGDLQSRSWRTAIVDPENPNQGPGEP
jgi:hypothetical protein